MSVYTVFVEKGSQTGPKQISMFVDGTKASIKAKMKSLGITRYTIGKIVPKAKLGLVKNIIKPGSIKKPAPFGSGLGRTSGGVNNPGMKIESSKGKGPTLTADKKDAIVQKVKNKNPKIPKSRILSWIKANPVKVAAGGAGLVGLIIGALGYALTPSKLADTTLPKSKTKKKLSRGVYKAPAIKSGQKDKSKSSSSVSVIIETPISKPKSNNNNKKKKTQNGSKSLTFNLIAGGKGTAKQRLSEEDAAKRFKKWKGRMPSNKELITFMDTNKKLFSKAMKMFNKKK